MKKNVSSHVHSDMNEKHARIREHDLNEENYLGYIMSFVSLHGYVYLSLLVFKQITNREFQRN